MVSNVSTLMSFCLLANTPLAIPPPLPTAGVDCLTCFIVSFTLNSSQSLSIVPNITHPPPTARTAQRTPLTKQMKQKKYLCFAISAIKSQRAFYDSVDDQRSFSANLHLIAREIFYFCVCVCVLSNVTVLVLYVSR